jgi:hypothetical protein
MPAAKSRDCLDTYANGGVSFRAYPTGKSGRSKKPRGRLTLVMRFRDSLGASLAFDIGHPELCIRVEYVFFLVLNDISN